ncbi:MAG: hypothetical protein ABSD85_15650 [Acidimicrobiales bacterium]
MPNSGCGTILPFGNLLALGVLRGLVEFGVAVPDEIAVVGYDA